MYITIIEQLIDTLVEYGLEQHQVNTILNEIPGMDHLHDAPEIPGLDENIACNMVRWLTILLLKKQTFKSNDEIVDALIDIIRKSQEA